MVCFVDGGVPRVTGHKGGAKRALVYGWMVDVMVALFFP